MHNTNNTAEQVQESVTELQPKIVNTSEYFNQNLQSHSPVTTNCKKMQESFN